jgi:hypothetical protein
MARPRNKPAYRRHTQTGRAIVTVYDADGNRRGVLLPGKFNSKESRAEYKRLTKGGKLPCDLAKERIAREAFKRRTEAAPDTTVNELVSRYFKERANGYYVNRETQEPTTELAALKEAVRPLVRLFGDMPAREFDSNHLEAVQDAMATGATLTREEKRKRKRRPLGMARRTINQHVHRIKRILRWGCKKRIIDGADFQSLLAVESLSAGRGLARVWVSHGRGRWNCGFVAAVTTVETRFAADCWGPVFLGIMHRPLTSPYDRIIA